MTNHRRQKDAPYELGDVVYLIYDPDTDLLKIGISGDLPSRLSRLRSDYGRQLQVLAFLHGYAKLERQLAEKFDHLKHNPHHKRKVFCDWFQRSDEIIEWFVTHGTPFRIDSDADGVKDRFRPLMSIYEKWAEAYIVIHTKKAQVA